ncbi:MAG: serine/threonine-protein kinase [Planctomycetota bacterium]
MSVSVLPLPVARLRRRSFNAKNPKERHDSAYFAWEASLRLTVAVSPPSDPKPLERGALGNWVGSAALSREKIEERTLTAVHALFTEGENRKRLVSPRELLGALPGYRNKVMGHGGQRSTRFYTEAGMILLDALDIAWLSGVFLPSSGRIYSVDSVSVDADASRVARLLNLTGESPLVDDPAGTPVPDTVLPRRLYWRETNVWRSLHPWLLFIDESERLYCFNGLGRRAQYLDYASGDILEGDRLLEASPAIEHELRELFGSPAPAPEEKPEQRLEPSTEIGTLRLKAPGFPSRFELQEKVSSDDVELVYRATDRTLKREVFVKRLGRAAMEYIGLDRAKHLREAQALARISHPGVLELYEVLESESGVILVIKPVQGEPLADKLAGEGPLPPDEVRDLALQLCDALTAVHAAGIVHRGLSAANILLRPDGSACLTGFSFAKPGSGLGLSSIDYRDAAKKSERSIPPHAAPEQIAGLPADARSDLFGLGCVLYECLTGQSVECGGEAWPPADLRERVPDAPRDLTDAIQRCLRRGPVRRFPTAAAFRKALEGAQVTEYHGDLPEPRRWKRLVIGILLAGILIWLATRLL